MAIPGGYRFGVPFDVPPEAIPGTPFRPAVFEWISALPYVRHSWVPSTLWAREMPSALAAGHAPAAKAQGGAALSTSNSAKAAA